MNSIHGESDQHRDIIVVDNFVDTYQNLILKTVSLLYWSNKYCRHIGWIIKMDDDIILNAFKLRGRLPTDPSDKFLIFGKVNKGVTPKRGGRWPVTPEQFNKTVYPDYVTGGCYGLTSNAINVILEKLEAWKKPLFWIEDVFTTGILRAGNLFWDSMRDFAKKSPPTPSFFD